MKRHELTLKHTQRPFEAIICISEGASVRDRDPALGPTTPEPVPDTGD